MLYILIYIMCIKVELYIKVGDYFYQAATTSKLQTGYFPTAIQQESIKPNGAFYYRMTPSGLSLSAQERLLLWFYRGWQVSGMVQFPEKGQLSPADTPGFKRVLKTWDNLWIPFAGSGYFQCISFSWHEAAPLPEHTMRPDRLASYQHFNSSLEG